MTHGNGGFIYFSCYGKLSIDPLALICYLYHISCNSDFHIYLNLKDNSATTTSEITASQIIWNKNYSMVYL